MFPKLQTLWRNNINSLTLFQQLPNCKYSAICGTCYLCNALLVWLLSCAVQYYCSLKHEHMWNVGKWHKLAHFPFTCAKNGGKAYKCYQNVILCHVFTVAHIAYHKISLATTETQKWNLTWSILSLKTRKLHSKILNLTNLWQIKPNTNLTQTKLNHKVLKWCKPQSSTSVPIARLSPALPDYFHLSWL